MDDIVVVQPKNVNQIIVDLQQLADENEELLKQKQETIEEKEKTIEEKEKLLKEEKQKCLDLEKKCLLLEKTLKSKQITWGDQKYEFISNRIFNLFTLTYFGISWRTIDDFLQQIGGTTCRTAHKWAETFIADDLDEFNEECRGRKRFDRYQRKDASFTSLEMAQYLDQQYYKLTGRVKTSDQLVRSERMCRLDLRRYGFTFDKNTQRSYWSGHERPDAVENRKEFVQAFLENKQSYYLVTDGINSQWIFPKQDPVILLSHSSARARTNQELSKKLFI
ncbi:unnamed protein product [Rotaria sordida]|uniref:Uncharacterized protein n=1 Tax=Rotaria sordida TaxID=392033 RepID=A0A813XMQ9_9BILA|nr:unnamed protein product [Rotaria sordida]CAF0917734.1 unnamed protein product [Rotaria sordida]